VAGIWLVYGWYVADESVEGFRSVIKSWSSLILQFCILSNAPSIVRKVGQGLICARGRSSNTRSVGGWGGLEVGDSAKFRGARVTPLRVALMGGTNGWHLWVAVMGHLGVAVMEGWPTGV
jgi:hypothetical protein